MGRLRRSRWASTRCHSTWRHSLRRRRIYHSGICACSWPGAVQQRSLVCRHCSHSREQPSRLIWSAVSHNSQRVLLRRQLCATLCRRLVPSIAHREQLCMGSGWKCVECCRRSPWPCPCPFFGNTTSKLCRRMQGRMFSVVLGCQPCCIMPSVPRRVSQQRLLRLKRTAVLMLVCRFDASLIFM